MATRPLSLYIHFPFCTRKCNYCDFTSIKYNNSLFANWLQGIQFELDHYADLINDFSNVKTLYIGGGTPGLMNSKQFSQLMNVVESKCSLSKLEEFTIEINPGNIETGLLESFSQFPKARLSIGCQSLNNDELQLLGRIHTTQDIFSTLEAIEKLGLKNYGLDFIYGIPGQTPESWRQTLNQVVKLNPPHLSLYNLSYEVGTPLYKSLDSNEIQLVDENDELKMFLDAHDILKSAGYNHYEISNWAKPGQEAVHNSAYWDGSPYLGIGPAAHSYIHPKRWWNTNDVSEYFSTINEGKPPVAEQEILSKSDQELEMLQTRLRTAQGLNIDELCRSFSIHKNNFTNQLEKYFFHGTEKDFLIISNGYLRMMPEGWFISDQVTGKIASILETMTKE